MKGKWISRLASINKELLLVLSIVAAAAAVNFLVAGQRLVLSFYNLPTLLAAYYFGRRHAVAAAVASVLFVVWMNLMNPMVLGGSVEPGQRLLTWSDLAIWAGFLLISAYVTGTLYESSARSLRELQEAYYGVLQILTQSSATTNSRKITPTECPSMRCISPRKCDCPCRKWKICEQQLCCTISASSKPAGIFCIRLPA
jgi:hypothetical protein